jgi:hypothetical protein
MSHIVKHVRAVVLLVAAAVTSTGCGLPGTGSGMSEDEAQVFAQQLSRAAAGGALSAQLQSSPGSNALSASREAVSCTQDGSSCTFNESVAYTVNCTAGGHIGLTGNLSGTMNSSGTGMLLIQVTETLTDWACTGDHVVNGDPYLSLAGHFSYMNGQPSTAQTMSLSGGFKTASQSCQVNLTINFGNTGHGTISGTLCGYGVNASF